MGAGGARDRVHVVTCEFPGAPAEETFNGVHIHRVTPYTPTDNFFHWVHQLNAAMRDRADALLREWTAGKTPLRNGPRQEPSCMRTIGWPTSAARELKYAYKLPLVATIHATSTEETTASQRYSAVYQLHRVAACV